MWLSIKGEPIAKKRHRSVRRGTRVCSYDPQDADKKRFRAACMQMVREKLNGPVSANLAFYRSRPKSHYGTGRNSGKLKPAAPVYPVTKFDVDNAVKFALDCLNGIAYHDDSQVVDITAIKRYSKRPRTEIILEEI